MGDGLTVAIQGIEGSNSQIALNNLSHDFRLPHTLHTTRSFPEFVELMKPESGIDYFLVPYINSTGGFVHEGLVGAVDNDLHVIADQFLPIRHFLVRRADDSTPKNVAFSHPQALRQCMPFLQEKGIEAKVHGDTALAAKDLSEKNIDGYAICSRLAAVTYPNLAVVQEVPFPVKNVTRFLFFKRTATPTPKQMIRNVSDYRLALVLESAMREANLGLLTALEESGMSLVQSYSFPQQSQEGRVFHSRSFYDFVFTVKDGYIFYKGKPQEGQATGLIPTGIPFRMFYERITREPSINVMGIYEMHKLGDGVKPFRYNERETHGIRYALTHEVPLRLNAQDAFLRELQNRRESAYPLMHKPYG